MRVVSIGRLVLACAAAVMVASGGVAPLRGEPQTPRKRVLAFGDTHTGFTHDSISNALSVVNQLGRETGLWDTFIRTDSQWITKAPVPAPARNARTLDDFDAVFFFVSGEGDLSEAQKRDLVSFVREDGKGLVAAHSGNAAFYEWSEYGEMVGGYFDNHPWNVVEARVRVEAPDFPAMRHFPPTFTRTEEYYVLRPSPYSRDIVRVLASIDPASVDLTNPNLRRTDNDFPVAMAREYGQGRTFWSTFGHTVDSWDDPAIRTMYAGALEWVLGLVDGDATPRSR
jgi:type 1 glutamine amidotransferase